MPKTYSTDLFDLIKSLNSAEKGYVKKFALRNSTKGNLVYLKLFDAIDSQEVFDEQLILKRLKYDKQLSQLKKYLYSAICKALDSYHAESNHELQLIKMLSMIAILYKKGLHKQCSKLLANAKKTARKHELHLYLLQLAEWERLILTNDSEEELYKIKRAQEEFMEDFKNTNEYYHLMHKFRKIADRNFSNRTKNDIVELKKLTDHPLFTSKSIPASWKAKSLFHEMKAFYYEFKGDFQKAYFHRKESLVLFENSTERKLQEPKAYLVALNNYIIILIRLKKYLEVEKFISFAKFFRKFNFMDENTQIPLFILYSNELHFYLIRSEFEKGMELIKEIESNLIKYHGKISREVELTLNINSAIVYFCLDDFSKTLYWLNKITSDTSLNIRPDIVCFAKILTLITHFELGNRELLEYVVRSTYRFLFEKGRLYKFEIIMLDFIRNKLSNLFTNKELILAFIELKEELEEIVKDPLEQKALESFDFISWLDSKIENRSFGEILREKLGFNLEEENE